MGTVRIDDICPRLGHRFGGRMAALTTTAAIVAAITASMLGLKQSVVPMLFTPSKIGTAFQAGPSNMFKVSPLN